MNKKRAIAWMGSLLILGLAFVFSADSSQKAAGNTYKNTVKSEFRTGPLFVDENGDGICDFAGEGKKNGTPNRQNPDWSGQKEGKSYQHKNENNASSDHFQNRFRHREEHTWNRQSAKQNRKNFGNGSGTCESTGPNGRISKNGIGQK